MIPLYRCQKNASIVNFTTDDMTSKSELFSKNKIYNLYLSESMRTYWLQVLDDSWDGKDASYSDDYCFWPDWLHQYFNELPLGESIESAYLVWKSEQHILTPKYKILCSLVPLLKHHLVTMYEDDNIFKITGQHCSGF